MYCFERANKITKLPYWSRHFKLLPVWNLSPLCLNDFVHFHKVLENFMCTSYVGVFFQHLHCTLVGQSKKRFCIYSDLENGCIKRPRFVFLSTLFSILLTMLESTHSGVQGCAGIYITKWRMCFLAFMLTIQWGRYVLTNECTNKFIITLQMKLRG